MKRRCWLVGHEPSTGRYHVVEGLKVGDITDGKQSVNIRPDCPRSELIVTLPRGKVHDSRESAEARCRQLQDAPKIGFSP